MMSIISRSIYYIKIYIIHILLLYVAYIICIVYTALLSIFFFFPPVQT